VLIAVFVVICCCRWNHRRQKIQNGKRRSLSKKRKSQIVRDEMVKPESSLYEPARDPIFRIPSIDDKGIRNKYNFINIIKLVFPRQNALVDFEYDNTDRIIRFKNQYI
jgi:hypothetical protein